MSYPAVELPTTLMSTHHPALIFLTPAHFPRWLYGIQLCLRNKAIRVVFRSKPNNLRLHFYSCNTAQTSHKLQQQHLTPHLLQGTLGILIFSLPR